MPNGYFFEDQAYPEQDPMSAARAMGLPMGPAMMGGAQGASFDPAELVQYYLSLGGNYNQYQGYPNKLVPDQLMDLVGPMPEYLLPQMYNIQNPDAGSFDVDAFYGADPMIRNLIAEAHAQTKGNPIDMYNYLNSNEPIEGVDMEGKTVMRPGFQDRLRQEIGRTEWDQLEQQGNLDVLLAQSPEEKDKAAFDFYMRGLEDVLAAGSPSSARAMQQLDYTRQREGFRPAPGTGQELPGYQGPGFGGGMQEDPMAALASSPAYSGAPEASPGPLQYIGEAQTMPNQGNDILSKLSQATGLGQREAPNSFTMGDNGFEATIGGRRFAVGPAPWERMALQRRLRDDFLNRRYGYSNSGEQSGNYGSMGGAAGGFGRRIANNTNEIVGESGPSRGIVNWIQGLFGASHNKYQPTDRQTQRRR